MSDELREHVRKYQEQVRKKTGLAVTFSNAACSLIEMGLRQV